MRRGVMPIPRTVVRALLAALPAAALAVAAAAQAPPPTIERLLADGWEIAGYVAAFENRTLILFRHRDHRHLVQCSVLIDVLRNPRQVVTCYELR